VRSRPQLSDAIQTLMQEAWLRASLAGEEQIRSLHLLMALVEKPSLIRCDGLWPLLTLAQSQLERLHPCWMRSRMSVWRCSRWKAAPVAFNTE
jgi:type VI secretion system protein VasG